MGLSLGFEAIVPAIATASNEEVDFLKASVELLEVENELHGLELEEMELLTGCENLLIIRDTVAELGVEQTLVRIAGNELSEIGIALDNVEMAIEKMGATIVSGYHRVVEWMKSIIAWAMDFIKKYVGKQAFMIKKLQAKADSIVKADWAEVSKKKLGSQLDAASVNGVIAMFKSEGNELKFLDVETNKKEDIEGFWAKVGAAFSKYHTGYRVQGRTMVADKDNGAKSGKTVAELGWGSAEEVAAAATKLKAIAEAWSTTNVYQNREKHLADAMKVYDEEATKDTPDKDAMKIALDEFKAIKAGYAIATKLLGSAEAAVLAIPSKPVKSGKEEPKEEPKKGK